MTWVSVCHVVCSQTRAFAMVGAEGGQPLSGTKESWVAPFAPYVYSGRRLAAPLDAGSLCRRGIGFVFAPPDRSILIQPSEVTTFASIANWLCLAPFSVPGPPRRERPDTPVPLARCCCLLRSYPSLPRTRHPPASAIRHPPFGLRHPPLFRRHPLDTRCPVSGSAGPISRQSGPVDPAWAKLVCVRACGIASPPNVAASTIRNWVRLA